MNLPDLYNRVVAKRPELAVPNVTHKADWWYGKVCGLSPHIAAALILARWVEALPEGHWLAHVPPSSAIPGGWRVWQSTKNGYNVAPLRSTILEALAAFYLGDSQ